MRRQRSRYYADITNRTGDRFTVEGRCASPCGHQYVLVRKGEVKITGDRLGPWLTAMAVAGPGDDENAAPGY